MTRVWSTNVSTRRDLRLALFIIACLGLALVGACGDRISNHGHIINENELKDINIGTTTRAELLDILGRPSFTGAFNTQKLFYSSLVMVQPIASTKQIKKRIPGGADIPRFRKESQAGYSLALGLFLGTLGVTARSSWHGPR